MLLKPKLIQVFLPLNLWLRGFQCLLDLGEIQGFPYWVGDGVLSPTTTSQKFSHLPTWKKFLPNRFPLPPNFYSFPTKSQFPSPLTKCSFSSYNPIKTPFLIVVIAPVLFLYDFILFWYTGHANFDFNWCSVHLFFNKQSKI